MFSHDEMRWFSSKTDTTDKATNSSWKNVSKSDCWTKDVMRLFFFFSFFLWGGASLRLAFVSWLPVCFAIWKSEVYRKGATQTAEWGRGFGRVQRDDNGLLKPLGHPDAHSIDVIDFPFCLQTSMPCGWKRICHTALANGRRNHFK